MSLAPMSTDWTSQARQRLDSLTKPPGSLGYLEDLAVRLVEIQETLKPNVTKKRLCLFAGSHGIAAANVSAYPAVVTGQMLQNFLAGGAAANVLARHAGVELNLIDVGVDADPVESPRKDFFNRRVRRGTRNFLEEPAMTPKETTLALNAGREQARLAKQDGVQILGIGEMGIGNTTSSSALISALMGLPPKIAVGRGTGIDDAGVKRKVEVVAQALKKHASCKGVSQWLPAVGGFEIAAMAGLILEAAALRLPVIVDGFVATAAAVVARRTEPNSLDTCLFAHVSSEQPHATVLPLLNARPILHLGMRLGEGTGSLLAMSIVEAAAKILNEMATFESAKVSST